MSNAAHSPEVGEALARAADGDRGDERFAQDGISRERWDHRQLSVLLRRCDAVLAITVLLGSFLLSNITRMPQGFAEFLELRLTVRNLLLLAAFALVWQGVCAGWRLYRGRWSRSARSEVARVVGVTTTAAVAALVFPLVSYTRAFSLLTIIHFWLGLTVALLLLRVALHAFGRQRTGTAQDIVIVGSGPRAVQLYRELAASPVEYRVLGFVDSPDTQPADVRDRWLGDLANLEQLLMRLAVDEVLIALPARSRYEDIQRTIDVCERGGVRARYLVDIFRHGRAGTRASNGDRFVTVSGGPAYDDVRLIVKRIVDIGLGGVLLLSVTPVLTLAALAICLTSRGPVVFSQERYGLNKRRFRMYKLRTMIVGAEGQQGELENRNEASGPLFKIRDDPRVTPVGRLLRRFSIDELPQLVNVLRGEMSLVGPRPLPIRDVSRFTGPELMRRFSVMPGLTCLWQISGRSQLGFEEWVRLDLEYIDRWSLGLDTEILLRTVPVVVRGTGAA
jgi:exopolysaccharide biosynthesis polyprenyl glycosylphosphotransferase